MKKIISILFFVSFLLSPNISSAVLKAKHWENAGWGSGGTYPQIFGDIEIPGRLYLVSDVTGQWLSEDYGEHWQWANGGDAWRSGKQAFLLQDPANPETLYALGTYFLRSEDRGRNWKALDNSGSTRPAVYKSIAINPTNRNDIVYGQDDGSIRRTTNYGTSFVTYGKPYNGAIGFLTFNPAGTRLYVSEQNENFGYYDIDNTNTFTKIILTGTNSERTRDFCSYVKDGVYNMCVPAGTRVACSNDDWNTINYTAETGIAATSYIRRLACTVDASNNVRMAISYTLLNTQYTGGERLSKDGGATWSGIDIGANYTFDVANSPFRKWNKITNPAFSINFDPFDATVMYKTDDLGVWKSVNEGVNWVEKTIGAQITVITDLELSPTNRLFASSMDNGLAYTDNWGVVGSWVQVYPNGTTSQFNQAGHIWQIALSGTPEEWEIGVGRVVATSTYWSDFKIRVLYSTNNGQTYQVSTSGLPTQKLNNGNWTTGYPRALMADRTDPLTFYMVVDGWNGSPDGSADDGGVFRTTNGGVNWQRLPQPPSWQTYNCLQMSLTDPATWFMGVFAGYGYYTTDAGTSYTQRTGGVPSYVYDCLLAPDNAFYVAGNSSGPYMSRSTGVTGGFGVYLDSINTSGSFDGIAINPARLNELAVGTFSAPPDIYMTYNRTATTPRWENITYDSPAVDGVNHLLFAPACGDNGCLFAAGNGTGVLRLDFEPTSGVTSEGVNSIGVESE